MERQWHGGAETSHRLLPSPKVRNIERTSNHSLCLQTNSCYVQITSSAESLQTLTLCFTCTLVTQRLLNAIELCKPPIGQNRFQNGVKSLDLPNECFNESTRNPISAKLVKISQISVTENRTSNTADTQSIHDSRGQNFRPHLQSLLQINSQIP